MSQQLEQFDEMTEARDTFITAMIASYLSYHSSVQVVIQFVQSDFDYECRYWCQDPLEPIPPKAEKFLLAKLSEFNAERFFEFNKWYDQMTSLDVHETMFLIVGGRNGDRLPSFQMMYAPKIVA